MISKKLLMIILLISVLLLSCGSSFAVTENNNQIKNSSLSKNTDKKILAAGEPTTLSQNSIWTGSKAVKNYIEKNRKLPNYVSISGEKYSMPEYLHLVSKSITYKYLKSTKSVNIEYNVKNPSNPNGVSINKIIPKSNYYDIAKRTYLYIEKYDQAPNYVSSKYGKIQYQTTIYGLSKIGAYIEVNKKIPTYLSLNIKKTNSMNKYLPKYTRSSSEPENPSSNTTDPTDNNINTKNKNAIWAHSGDMNKIDLDSLVDNGIGNIFIHEDIFKSKTAALNWISTATKKGINIHVWFTCFYDTSAKKWINPIDTSTKTFNQNYFNNIISRAKEYASYSGVAGIHLDYLRYPGTAYKYDYSNDVTGTSAITEFTKQLSTAVKNVKSNIILSAAIMPETSNNAKYYGQDSTQLGKYLDVIVPMIYKGNYGKTSTWITTTTNWFVKNSGGAEIWGGIQTYKSDSDVTKLSTSALSTDSKAIISGGALGVALFRWGLINMINFSNI